MENKDTLDYIMRLARVTRRNRPGRKEDSLSRSAFRVMANLHKKGPMRASDLARQLDIRPASLTEQLTGIESRGLIRREKDPADMRALLVILTDQGRGELDRSREERLSWNAKFQEALTEEEHAQFARLSEKLISFFEKEKGHAR